MLFSGEWVGENLVGVVDDAHDAMCFSWVVGAIWVVALAETTISSFDFGLAGMLADAEIVVVRVQTFH